MFNQLKLLTLYLSKRENKHMNSEIEEEKKYFKVGIYLMIITSVTIIALVLFYEKEDSKGLGCITVQNRINALIEEQKKHNITGIKYNDKVQFLNKIEQQLKANKALECGFPEKEIRSFFD